MLFRISKRAVFGLLFSALCAAALARPAAAATKPSGLHYVYVTETEAIVSWNTHGNSTSTLYNVQFSSGNFSQAFAGDKDITGDFNGTLLAGGFLPNTVYNARVRVPAGPDASFTGTVSSSTLSLRVDSFTLDAGSAALTAAWTPLPSSPQDQSCEGYVLNVSTDAAFNGSVSSAQTASCAAASLSVSGLSNNTTYYSRLGTLNWSAQANNSDGGSFATLTAPPSGFALGAVYISSAALSWTAFPPSPPSATASGYRVDASSTAFAAGSAVFTVSADGYAQNSALAVNLLGNTTWSFHLAALNRLGEPLYGAAEPSTATLSFPVDINTVQTAVSPHDATVSWTPLPSSPDYFSCNGYLLSASSTNFSGGTVFSASSTVAATASLPLQNLSANTLYYGRLGTLNRSGTPDYIAFGPFTTPLGSAPANLQAASAGTGSITLSWTATSCDGYTASASTSPYFTGTVYSAFTANPAATQLAIPGLSPNIAYYLRAGTVYNGTTNYASAGITPVSTLAGAVSSPQVLAVWFSSAVFNWTAPAACSGYKVDMSTDSGFGGILYSSSTSNPLLTSLVPQTDATGINPLQPNTSYYTRIGSLNLDNAANFTLLAAPTVTLVNPVLPLPYTSVNENDLRMNWNPNSNPGDTFYSVQLATDTGFAAPAASSVTANAFFNATGLNANAVYFARAFSRSRAGGQQGPVLFPTIQTLSRMPIPEAYTTVGVSSVTANWNINLNPAGTFYDVQLSTSTGFETHTSSVTLSSAPVISGLNANTVYYGQVASVNAMGLYSAFVSLGSFLTNPAVPADMTPASADFSDVRNDQI
ncbi:MAG: fibronectin type III domain-containing protein, partial [Candidatus Paceibacterota bacterium]